MHPLESPVREHLVGLARHNSVPSPEKEIALRMLHSNLSNEVQRMHAELLAMQAKMDSIQNLQQEVKLILSARRRIPSEIWAYIFVLAMFTDLVLWEPESPFSIMLTCRDWYRIAMSTPELWAYIYLHIESPPTSLDKLNDSVGKRLSLSKSHPLRVHIECRGIMKLHEYPRVEAILALLLRSEASRIRTLCLDANASEFRIFFPIMTENFPMLSHLEIRGTEDGASPLTDSEWASFSGLFPELRSVVFESSSGIPFNIKWDQLDSLETDDVELVADALLRAPSIRKLTVEDHVRLEDITPAIFCQDLVNETIQTLSINVENWNPSGFLKFVDLRALQRMAVKRCNSRSFGEAAGQNLINFMSRTKLVYLALEIDLDEEGGALHLSHLRECFENSLPCLKVLKIIEYYDGFDDPSDFPLLSSLHHGYDSPTLRSLETFKLRLYSGRFSGEDAGDVCFAEFLSQLESLVFNRVTEWPSENSQWKDVSLLRTLVINSGGKNIEQFPSFLGRLKAWEAKGLEFYFDKENYMEEGY